MKNKNLVLLRQKEAEAIPYGFFVNIALEDFRVFMHNRQLVISTHIRKDGSLIHCITESEHEMTMKVPDYKFVGYGKWEWREH